MKKTIAKGTIQQFILLAPELDDKVRTVRVYLPPDYESGKKRYPVLYMHDGQNLFYNKDTAFKVGSWGIHQSLNHMFNDKVNEGFIVVGLDSSALDRSREMSLLPVNKRYTPKSPKPRLGDVYSKFFAEKLKKYIDHHYRTNVDEAYIGGSSMGGIISLLMALEYPSVYRGALCFTPAGMIHYQKDIKAYFADKISEMKEKNILLPKLYFMVGGVGLENIIKPFCDMAVPYLISLGYEYNKNITYLYKPKAVHNEKAWERVFPHAFMWMTRSD